MVQHNEVNDITSAKAFIFDMDGVLYRGKEALPGVEDLFNTLTLKGIHFLLATNNSMATREAYVTRMAAMGVTVTVDQIQTSASATRDFLVDELPEGAVIHPVGMPALTETLLDNTTFRIAEPDQVEGVDAVVVGLDLEFTYAKLKHTAEVLKAGARFVATNADATLPHENGEQPGAGSIVAAIATGSGKTPIVVGKPETLMMIKGVEGLGVQPGEAIMVGDRLDTDILAGCRAGLKTVLVLTGVSQREDLATAEVLPDYVFADLPSLMNALTEG